MPSPYGVLKRQTNWEHLYFYRKSVVLYQLTVLFCQRFLPAYGDRTVDQMVQAARSGKQNIVEGHADGVTSTEMELKLLNVARASIQELREDYADYLAAHHLPLWDDSHPRYRGLVEFCRHRNDLAEYEPFFPRWNDEESANAALTLCHMVDRMLCSYLECRERDFVEHGGIKERMHAARTGYRRQQDDELQRLQTENAALQAELERLRALLKANSIEF